MRDQHYSKSKMILVGPVMFIMGIASAAVVGGALFLKSNKGQKYKRKLAYVMDDAQDEIVNKARKIKDISQDKFDELSDTVVEKYSKWRDLTQEQIDSIKKKAKDKWQEAEEAVNDEDSEI